MEKKTKITVLVTGFGPFGPYEINPSWEAVKILPDLFETWNKSCNVNLITVQVPVSYEHVASNIKELWEKHKPSIIVHVGVSGEAMCLAIESQACNKGYKRPDIFEKFPEENDIDHVTLTSNCKIQEICEIINKHSKEINCKATISYDAGKYLCEYIYFQSLNLGAPQVLFVHVPDLDIYTSKQSAQGLLKIITFLIECLMNDECT